MSAEPEVLFDRRGRAGIITLNRPRALNTLTWPMVRAMSAELARWAEDGQVDRVVIRGSGEKAFCAGGDIRKVRELGLARDPDAVAFFRDEYRLNAAVKRFPKPYLAMMDGLVMGGGLGVSVHGTHRLCGETSLFAMPEAAIGFFPDIGATYFLPRLPGRLGTYMALTGARLGPADALWSGLATHAVPRARFEELLESLCTAPDFDRILAEHSVAAEPAPILRLMPAIDRCFSADSAEAILEALAREEEGEFAAWAAETIETMRTKSPLSLKIALRQMREGEHADLEECLRIEFRLANRVLRGRDFYEGVRAVILDKDNKPRWSHPDVESVSDAEVDAYFAPLGPDELTFP